MSESLPTPDLKFRMDKFLRRYNAIKTCLHKSFGFDSVNTSWIEHTLVNLTEDIGIPKLQWRTFSETLYFYYGQELTLALEEEYAWRLTAGWDRMRYGKHLAKEFCLSGKAQWQPCLIDDVRFRKPSLNNKAIINLDIRVLDGPFGGLLFTQPMSFVYLIGRMAKEIGFGKYDHVHPMQVCRMLFAGVLDISINPEHPTITEFSMLNGGWNSKLRKARKAACSFGHKWLCHVCPKGYHTWGADEQCNLATHRKSYTNSVECVVCHKHEMMDPVDREKVCVWCRLAEAKIISKMRE